MEKQMEILSTEDFLLKINLQGPEISKSQYAHKILENRGEVCHCVCCHNVDFSDGKDINLSDD